MKIQKKLKRFTSTLFLLLCVSLLGAIFIGIVQEESLTVIEENYKREIFTSIPDKELLKGDMIKGVIKANEHNLGIIAIRFNTYGRINTDTVVFRIKEQGSKDWYYVNEYQSRQFGGYPLFPFGFPIIADSKGKYYYFELESMAGKPGDAVGIDTGRSAIAARHKFTVNQLLSDKKTFMSFTLQKGKNIIESVHIFQIFASIYIPLVSVFIITHYRGELFTFGSNLLGRLGKKVNILGKAVSITALGIGVFLKMVFNVLHAIGKILVNILALFYRWIGKE